MLCSKLEFLVLRSCCKVSIFLLFPSSLSNHRIIPQHISFFLLSPPSITLDFPSFFRFLYCMVLRFSTHHYILFYTLWICHYDFLTREDHPRRTGPHQRFSGPYNQRSGIFPFFLADGYAYFFLLSTGFVLFLFNLFNFCFVWMILGYQIGFSC